MVTERVKRKLAAIFSADVKGYSRLMGDDEVSTVRTLTAYRELMAGCISRHGGRVVDSPGDNMLAEFASVVDAVECAVEMQEKLKIENDKQPKNRKMEYRIGINLGDVIEDDERIYGDGVNIAARVEGLAEAGGICISGTVFDQVESKVSLNYQYLGEQKVRNIRKPVRVYRIGEGKESVEPLTGIDENQQEKPSIAVLPFVNMSGDSEQEYFSDGITEDLITDLSKVSGLFVIARNTVFTYKGRPVNINEVGKELGVRYVLEGSVRKANSRVRINAQLIDAKTGGHLWAERYDNNLEDIFELQDKVTQEIVSALAVKLTEDEQYHRVCKCEHSCNIEAYDFYLRGLEYINRFTEEKNKLARDMFKKAIEVDPRYALAHAMVGETHLIEWLLNWTLDPQVMEEALKWANAALEIDDKVPEAHNVLAEVYLWMREHNLAYSSIKKAISLNPNNADFIATLGYIKTFEGYAEEGISLITRAMRLNPVYPVYYVWHLGHAFYMTGQHDKAIEAFERALNLNSDMWPSYVYMAAAYAEIGRLEDAREAAEKVMKAQPSFSLEHWEIYVPYKNPKDRDRWVKAARMAGFK